MQNFFLFLKSGVEGGGRDKGKGGRVIENERERGGGYPVCIHHCHKLARTVLQITCTVLNTNRIFDRRGQADKKSPHKSHGVEATPDRTLTRIGSRKSMMKNFGTV